MFSLYFFLIFLEKLETKLIKYGFATGQNFFKTQITQNMSNSNHNPFEETNRLRYIIKQENLVYYAITKIENLGNCKIKFYCDDENK